MENHRRSLSRSESERGSTSNRGESSSRSERTNSRESGSRHPARDANIRSLGINRSTWNQEIPITDARRVLNQIRDLTIDQQRGLVQDYINTIPIDQRQEWGQDFIRHLSMSLLTPQGIQRMNDVLASRQRQNQLPEVNQQIQPISQPPVEHRPTEQHIEGGSTSNRGDNFSRLDRANSPESGPSHPTRDANIRSRDRNRGARNQRSQRFIRDYITYLTHNRPPIMYTDIRPSNILLREDRSVLVADFGIADRRHMPLADYQQPEQMLNSIPFAHDDIRPQGTQRMSDV